MFIAVYKRVNSCFVKMIFICGINFKQENITFSCCSLMFGRHMEKKHDGWMEKYIATFCLVTSYECFDMKFEINFWTVTNYRTNK